MGQKQNEWEGSAPEVADGLRRWVGKMKMEGEFR